MNDIHLAATSQPVMMAGKVTQAISAQKMFFFYYLAKQLQHIRYLLILL